MGSLLDVQNASGQKHLCKSLQMSLKLVSKDVEFFISPVCRNNLITSYFFKFLMTRDQSGNVTEAAFRVYQDIIPTLEPKVKNTILDSSAWLFGPPPPCPGPSQMFTPCTRTLRQGTAHPVLSTSCDHSHFSQSPRTGKTLLTQVTHTENQMILQMFSFRRKKGDLGSGRYKALAAQGHS